MTAPEVTREAAARILEPHLSSEEFLALPSRSALARTVVALYDRLDLTGEVGQALQVAVDRVLIEGSVRIRRDERGTVHVVEDPYPAMRECIDRLRDGYQYDTGTSWADPAEFPRWVRLNADRTDIEAVRLTEAQRAVMAR